MIESIFLDFDGVIRHWSNIEVTKAEAELALPDGTFFSVIFSDSLAQSVITGKISHQEWMRIAQTRFTEQYGHDIANHLIAAWQQVSWEIDYDFLEQIEVIAPACQLVLVTNASSQLSADLETANLRNRFDVVVNSSDIGVAKPNPKFFQKALTLSKTEPNRVLYIDDTLENIEAARAMGIESLHFQNRQTVLECLRQSFS